MGAEENRTHSIPSAALGSAERSPRSASASVRLVQCGTTAGVGAVDVGLPGPFDGPANLTRSNGKRKS